MSGYEFIVLGTASQLPTRKRSHNCYVLRWQDKLFMFDPGEGSQRQCTLAGISIPKISAIFVTHFHGDHCLGLPGIIQRRSLENSRHIEPDMVRSLPIYFPASGQKYLERMQSICAFHDKSETLYVPIGDQATSQTDIEELQLTTKPLLHRVPTLGFRLEENPKRKFDPEKLKAKNIAGPKIKELIAHSTIMTDDGTIHIDEVSHMAAGKSFAFVMDTSYCQAAIELAKDVDLLVCESTYLESEKDLAKSYKHLTALEAAQIADTAGAKRLVLSHYSSRYSNVKVFAEEASQIHQNVVAAKDLDIVPF